MTIIQAEYFIFYNKYDKGKLELIMSVHVYDVFMAVSPETLENIKKLINLKFNIQEYGEVRKFLVVDYEWCHDDKGPLEKNSMEKDVREFYQNIFQGS